MGVIIYNGVSSKDLHIQVEHPPGYEFPERDYTITHVPGRNGDVVQDSGSYKNVDRSYDLAIAALDQDYASAANKISEWLHSSGGYGRLEDSYEPEYYRMALFKDKGTIANLFNKAGRITVQFNCKPQRFLKAGEKPVGFTSTSNGIIRNPTGFTSLPIITVKGTGEGLLTVGSYIVKISNINGSIVIDSMIQDAYSGSKNRNSDISLEEFPKLEPGLTTIGISGGITSVEIIPNWWTL